MKVVLAIKKNVLTILFPAKVVQDLIGEASIFS